jgi:hypothetical protein
MESMCLHIVTLRVHGVRIQVLGLCCRGGPVEDEMRRLEATRASLLGKARIMACLLVIIHLRCCVCPSVCGFYDDGAGEGGDRALQLVVSEHSLRVIGSPSRSRTLKCYAMLCFALLSSHSLVNPTHSLHTTIHNFSASMMQ